MRNAQRHPKAWQWAAQKAITPYIGPRGLALVRTVARAWSGPHLMDTPALDSSHPSATWIIAKMCGEEGQSHSQCLTEP